MKQGSVATTFNLSERLFSEELARCMWYFERLNFDDLDHVGDGAKQASTTLDATLHFRPKRVQPTFEVSSNSDFGGRVLNTIEDAATTTFFQANIAPFDRSAIRVDNQTGTSGDGGNIQASKNSAFIDIKAEL